MFRLSAAVGAALLLGACGGGGSGGTNPPGPPTQLVKSAGDAQNWYFNNPLPAILSVTVEDADGKPVPNIVVTWNVASGGGAVSPTQSTSNANGVATTVDSIGSSTLQTVTATFTGFPSTVTFNEAATTPPTTGSVDIKDNFFSPNGLAVQVGGSVTWTWAGSTSHTLTFTSGPAPLPAETPAQMTGTRTITFNSVGSYAYHCTIHSGMAATLTIVH